MCYPAVMGRVQCWRADILRAMPGELDQAVRGVIGVWEIAHGGIEIGSGVGVDGLG